MNRVRVKELALVAVAGGLLAFEVIGLKAALPAAAEAFSDQGVLGEMKAASLSAAVSATSVLDETSLAVSHAAVGVVKRAARILGAATLLPSATGRESAVGGGQGRSRHPGVWVITGTAHGCRAARAAPVSPRRAREIRRVVEAGLRRSAL